MWRGYKKCEDIKNEKKKMSTDPFYTKLLASEVKDKFKIQKI